MGSRTIDPSVIPQTLRALARWVCWRYETRGDKKTKVPYRADGHGCASSTNSSHWSSFDAAVAAAAANPSYDGIGFVLGDGIVGIDLDHCRDAAGTIEQWAMDILARFDTYSEVSPSGAGVKLFMRGALPSGWRKHQHVEVYSEGRYFTVTGQQLPGAAGDVMDCGEGLAKWHAAIATERAAGKPPRATPARPAAGNRPSAAERCKLYLAKCPEAISGSDGHTKTFRAACECFRFGLSDADAWDVLQWFNGAHCQPPWNDRELQHKLEQGRQRVAADGQFGCRLTEGRSSETYKSAPAANKTSSSTDNPPSPVDNSAPSADPIDRIIHDAEARGADAIYDAVPLLASLDATALARAKARLKQLKASSSIPIDFNDLTRAIREHRQADRNRSLQAASDDGSALTDARPMTLANAYMKFKGYLPTSGHPAIWHWRDEFYVFRRCSYERQITEELIADVTTFLNRQHVWTETSIKPLDVGRKMVAETIAQMRAMRQACVQAMPAWLDDWEGITPRNVLAFENGLIDAAELVGTDAPDLHPPTPCWFSETAIPCKFDPAATCPRWLQFLTDSLAGNAELIQALQEWFGYCLTQDTSQQKMLWLHGQPGQGKGTIARMMKYVIGERNTVSFSLGDLSERFTLSSFVGKTLAISGDAELGHDEGSRRVLEQVKAITGEDDRLIDRKNRDLLPSIRLGTRFVICVNQFPSLPDGADALRRRSIIIPVARTTPGAADVLLGDRLREEVPGIVAWAVQGLRALRRRGHFQETQAGVEMQERFSRLTSPVRSFVEECCELKEGAWEKKDALYAAYARWTKDNGHKAASKDRFCEALLSAAPSVRNKRTRDGDERERVFDGIELLPQQSHTELPF